MNERLAEGIIGRGALRCAMLVALAVLALLQATGAWAQPAVLQRGYDANVSGATLTETTLNSSNVVPGGFGLVFTLAVDDNIMAQPLYVPQVTINGSAHNVLYVATMSDTLYAFGADVGGAPLWTRNLATLVGATPMPIAQFAYSGNKNLINNLGILGTPVIDAATNPLYAVAGTLENNTIVYRLHAVDITSGTPRTGSGVVISGSYGAMTFDARNEWQRVSLVLSGNNVVFGFGALELESTAHLYSGWVMGYDKTTLAQTGIFATVTSGNGAPPSRCYLYGYSFALNSAKTAASLTLPKTRNVVVLAADLRGSADISRPARAGLRRSASARSAC